MVGTLRDRITVRTPVIEATELNGQEITDWDEYDTWADVETMKGLRAIEYLRIIEKVPYVITMRSRITEPTPLCRITWKTKDLKIHSVSGKSKGQFIEVVAYSEEAAT
jgi:head-tail adaptor